MVAITKTTSFMGIGLRFDFLVWLSLTFVA